MQSLQRVTSDFSEYEILQRFYDDLPSKPYCSDTKCLSLVRPKATASKQPYIQANHPQVIKWLFVDIDSPLKANKRLISYFDENLLFRFHDRNLPEPQIIMRNPVNGHVQYAYKLKDPVSLFENSRQAPVKYLKALQYALTVQLGGDLSFGGSLAKNPLDTSTWDIFITGAEPYSLSDLHSWLDLDDPTNQPPKRPRNAQNDDHVSPFAGLGRNCDTFDYLRFIAYPIAHKMSQTALFNHLMKIGLEFNSRFKQPMLLSEVRAICRSIAKFCKTSPKYKAYTLKFSKKQAEKGRKGGLMSDSSHGGLARSASYESKREQAKQLREHGLSIRKIAEQLDVSKTTIQKWVNSWEKVYQVQA